MDSEHDTAYLHFMDLPIQSRFIGDVKMLMRWNIAANTCAFYASIETISILKHIHHKPLSVGSIYHECGIIYISEFTYIHIYRHI